MRILVAVSHNKEKQVMRYRNVVLAAVLLVAGTIVVNPSSVSAHQTAAPGTYTVQPGDTLSAIAARLGVGSWQVLWDANRDRIGNPNVVQIGQVLIVPGIAATAAPVIASPTYALPLPPAAVGRSAYAAPHHTYPAVDLPVWAGTPVYAIQAGTVSHWGGDCGIGVLLIADSGERYLYCHLSSRIAAGSRVVAGTWLGASGSTGDSIGNHLHIESGDGIALHCPQEQLLAIYDGRAVPPVGSLPTSGCTFVWNR
jgi:murein DD-endopeptidase MepM/ murein hydrolase activator NlpD